MNQQLWVSWSFSHAHGRTRPSFRLMPGQAEKIAELEPLIEGAEVLGWHWKGPGWGDSWWWRVEFIVWIDICTNMSEYVFYIKTFDWTHISIHETYPKCFGVCGKSSLVLTTNWLLTWWRYVMIPKMFRILVLRSITRIESVKWHHYSWSWLVWLQILQLVYW